MFKKSRGLSALHIQTELMKCGKLLSPRELSNRTNFQRRMISLVDIAAFPSPFRSRLFSLQAQVQHVVHNTMLIRECHILISIGEFSLNNPNRRHATITIACILIIIDRDIGIRLKPMNHAHQHSYSTPIIDTMLFIFLNSEQDDCVILADRCEIQKMHGIIIHTE